MLVVTFDGKTPCIAADAFLAPTASVIGDVVLAERANVWYGAVLRADIDRVAIGAGTSFQDNAVAHADPGYPVTVGSDCIIGHLAMVHGATIGARCLIGIGAVLLNGCEIGDESIVAAGALVIQGKRYPPRSVLMGSPARVVREASDQELVEHMVLVERYVRRAQRYREQGLATDARRDHLSASE